MDFCELKYVTRKHQLLVNGYVNKIQLNKDANTIPQDIIIMIILISNQLEEFTLGENPHSKYLRLSKDNCLATITEPYGGWISAFGKLRIERHYSFTEEIYEWTFNIKVQTASIGIISERNVRWNYCFSISDDHYYFYALSNIGRLEFMNANEKNDGYPGQNYCKEITMGDEIKMRVDAVSGRLSFCRNGCDLGIFKEIDMSRTYFMAVSIDGFDYKASMVDDLDHSIGDYIELSNCVVHR